MQKTIFSLKPNERYQRIGQTDAKKIVKLVSNYSARSSMKPVVQSLGTSKVSVLNFIKKFKKSSDVDKVVRAVQKNFNKGVDPAIQKRYLKANMQIDKPFLEKDDDDGNKNISILGKVGGGVHGQASRLGVGLKQTQSRVSALDLNSSKPFINSGTQKMPSSGDRPIGL